MPVEVLQVMVLNLVVLTGFAIWLITVEKNNALDRRRDSG